MTPKAVLKTRVQAGSSVDKKLWDQLRQLSKETRIPISRLLDEAIEDLLVKYEKK